MTRHRLHPPKVERFDLGSMTNTDPKGHTRKVDDFRLTESGLYLARPVIDHPEFAYLQSWILPAVGLRVTSWTRHPGIPAPYDRYIDIVDIEPLPGCWRVVDLYLDITVRTGRDLRVLDTEELTEALITGLITPEDGHRALTCAFRAAAGIASASHNVERWLTSINRSITWRDDTQHQRSH